MTLVQSALPGNSAGSAPSEVNANAKSEGLRPNPVLLITTLHTLRVPVGGVGKVPFPLFPVPPATTPAVAAVDWRLLLWSLNPVASLSFPLSAVPDLPGWGHRSCSKVVLARVLIGAIGFCVYILLNTVLVVLGGFITAIVSNSGGIRLYGTI